MVLKRINLVLLIAVIAGMLYLTFSIEKMEVLKLGLVGTLKCRGGEFAVAAFQNRINLYAPTGERKAYYKVQDAGGEVVSCCISDIDGDSSEELLVVEGDGKEFYGLRLVILSYNNGLKKNYEREFKELNPWKVQTCDIDGDRRREIALGVYKEARFHPVMAKRPFLYHWDKGDIVPVWRGSRLSRPFKERICGYSNKGRAAFLYL